MKITMRDQYLLTLLDHWDDLTHAQKSTAARMMRINHMINRWGRYFISALMVLAGGFLIFAIANQIVPLIIALVLVFGVLIGLGLALTWFRR